MSSSNPLVERLRLIVCVHYGDTMKCLNTRREAADEIERLDFLNAAQAEAIERLQKRLDEFQDFHDEACASIKALSEATLTVERLQRELKDATSESRHCRNCCCALVWRALGVEARTDVIGDIGDYVKQAVTERDRLRAALERIANPTHEGYWLTRPGAAHFISLAQAVLAMRASSTTTHLFECPTCGAKHPTRPWQEIRKELGLPEETGESP